MVTGVSVITLTDVQPDGAALVQSWPISPADSAQFHTILSRLLGAPYTETLATPEAAAAFAETYATMPGVITEHPNGHPGGVK